MRLFFDLSGIVTAYIGVSDSLCGFSAGTQEISRGDNYPYRSSLAYWLSTFWLLAGVKAFRIGPIVFSTPGNQKVLGTVSNMSNMRPETPLNPSYNRCRCVRFMSYIIPESLPKPGCRSAISQKGQSTK